MGIITLNHAKIANGSRVTLVKMYPVQMAKSPLAAVLLRPETRILANVVFRLIPINPTAAHLTPKSTMKSAAGFTLPTVKKQIAQTEWLLPVSVELTVKPTVTMQCF